MDPLSCNRGFHESWLVICGGTVVDGTEAETFAADVNVLDIHNLEERMPEIVHDFPFGAPRFVQRAQGYKATVVNGDIILRDDELTGNYPGRVLRNS